MTKRTHAIALVRQVCALPVPVEQIAPLFVPMLKDLIEADSLCFVWPARSALRWSRWTEPYDAAPTETQLSVLASTLSAKAEAIGQRDWAVINHGADRSMFSASVCVRANDPNDDLSQALTDCDRQSRYLALSVLFNDSDPLCWIVACRGQNSRAFDERTLDVLRSLAPSLVAIADRVGERGIAPKVFAWIDSGEEGVILLGPRYENLGASTLATDLVARALNRPEGSTADHLAALRSLLSLHAASTLLRSDCRLDAGVTPGLEHTLENAWGRFLIRVTPLLGESGRQILSVRRQEAEVVGLLRRMNDQPLSPQQREVLILRETWHTKISKRQIASGGRKRA